MTRYSLTLTLATLALSALSHPLSAHAEVEEPNSGIYVRLQTGFQSGSLNATSKLSSALEADLGIGLLARHFAIEGNFGLSLSGQDYRRSEIIRVNSYLGTRAEGALYYRATSGRASILVGGGVGWRQLDQSATYQYQEGELLQITSDTQRELTEEAMSVLIRLALFLEGGWAISADYDIFSLVEGEPSIKTLGINFGYVF